MIERPPINRQPLGLLGFLDLRTQGENPRSLAPFVQPTLDMESFYSLNSLSSVYQRVPTAVASPAFTALTNNPLTWTVLQNQLPEGGTVPANEAWIVEGFCVNSLDIAAIEAPLPAYLYGDSFHVLPFSIYQSNDGLSTVATQIGTVKIPPTARLGVWVSVQSATQAIQANVRVMRLRV